MHDHMRFRDECMSTWESTTGVTWMTRKEEPLSPPHPPHIDHLTITPKKSLMHHLEEICPRVPIQAKGDWKWRKSDTYHLLNAKYSYLDNDIHWKALPRVLPLTVLWVGILSCTHLSKWNIHTSQDSTCLILIVPRGHKLDEKIWKSTK